MLHVLVVDGIPVLTKAAERAIAVVHILVKHFQRRTLPTIQRFQNLDVVALIDFISQWQGEAIFHASIHIDLKAPFKRQPDTSESRVVQLRNLFLDGMVELAPFVEEASQAQRPRRASSHRLAQNPGQ